MSDVAVGFLASAVRTATPLAFAALGEVVVEKAGVINIGLEGVIICGAFGATIGSSSHGVWVALLIAGICGVLTAALFALFVIGIRADQIVTGTAISLLALGLTGTLYRQAYGAEGVALTIATMRSIQLPMISSIPLVGASFFGQPAVTYLLYMSVPTIWWWLYRTHAGLNLRAVGENPEAAIAAGIRAARVQLNAILFGGFMGGVAGGILVTVQSGTFAEGMSAGRGFIAIAIVVLGRWKPAGVALAAFVFGVASAIQYLFQTRQWDLPYQIFLAFPYLLTLLGLAGVAGRARSPASLGKWVPND